MTPIDRVQLLLAELKRRKVFRVAAVYGATAFVVLQVADLMLPRLGLPDWTVTLVVALSVLGFPVAIALAWVFESGPEGVRRTEAAPVAELRAIIAEPRARRWPAGIAALLGILLLAGGTVWTTSYGSSSRTAYDSIAVLPFANLSGQPENDYFGDGLAEELLNALSGINGLRVAARTSAFAFRTSSLDVRTIGDTLNVATVLEGSVRRSEDRVRISVQLVDAKSGYQLWSDSYDRPLTHLFDVQDEIAKEIVKALAIRLAPAAQSDLYRGGTQNVTAYDLYLEGRQKWATREVPLLREAVAHFEAAVKLDPGFALAWSGLADAIDALAYRDGSALPLVPHGKYAAQRALVLEPQLAEAWASLGVLYGDFDRDAELAELALLRAVELKPSYASAQHWLGDLYLRFGRTEEAIEYAARAVELDPLSGLGINIYALALLNARRWQESRALQDQLRERGWAEPTTYLNMVSHAREYAYSADEAAALAQDWARLSMYALPSQVAVVGRAVIEPELRPEALRVLRQLEQAGIRPRDLAEIAAALGDFQGSIRLIRRAVEEADPRMVRILYDPIFDPMRGMPEFQRVIDAVTSFGMGQAPG